eukprot:3463505-Amphidinium_carterae.1
MQTWTILRSHAVCAIQLLRSGGQLLLVDCAGTERKKDAQSKLQTVTLLSRSELLGCGARLCSLALSILQVLFGS